MTKEEAINFVNTRSWYQTINFGGGLVSKGCPWCGELAWESIADCMPRDLTGKRILDLGCNAGLFCVNSALSGAKEAVGVDYAGWRLNWDFKEQREFVKEYFEWKYNRKLPVKYIEGRMEDVLKTDIGRFDYVLAIASIYYTSDPEGTVAGIARITDKVILRLRDDSRIIQFTSLFLRNKFKMVYRVREKVWEKIKGITGDDFYMFLFERASLNDRCYIVLNYHRQIFGHNEPVYGKQLCWLEGEISPEHLTKIKFKDILDITIPAKISLKENEKYPWDKLTKSVNEQGILSPPIAEEITVKGGKILYRLIEGRHRIRAATLSDWFNPEKELGVLVVKDVTGG